MSLENDAAVVRATPLTSPDASVETTGAPACSPGPTPDAYDACMDLAADGPAQFLVPAPDTTYLYVLEQLTFNSDSLQGGALLDAQQAMLGALGSDSWSLILRGYQISGDPTQTVQLWRVPADFSLARTAFALLGARGGLAEDYRKFRLHLRSQAHQVLSPMPYDPGRGKVRRELHTNSGGAQVILIDRISVNVGAMRRFACLKERMFLPLVSGRQFGWSLVASGAALTGPLGDVFNCWLLPSADRLRETMAAFSDFDDYHSLLTPCIAQERQTISSAKLYTSYERDK